MQSYSNSAAQDWQPVSAHREVKNPSEFKTSQL